VPESTLSPAAQAVYNNRRDAVERTIRVQMANLTPQMYQNFQDITSKYSSISPDLAMSMVSQGLNANTPGIDKIVSADGISQLKRDQFNVDKIKSTVDRDKGILGAISSAYRSTIYDPLKGATRIAFAALRYPYDLVTTLTRDIFAFDEPSGTQGTRFLKDLATLGGKNTQLGALIADAVGGKPGVQTGSGFFINPNSRVGKAQARAMSSYGTIEGESFTIGRNVFRAMADSPDKTGYKVASGIVDAVLNVGLDPSTWFFGAGAATKILKGTKKFNEAKETAKIFAPETLGEIAKGERKRMSNNLARNERKLAQLEAQRAQQASKGLNKILRVETDSFKSVGTDAAAKETLSPRSLANWMVTNPKVQNGEMLRGLDALSADQKALAGFADAGIFMDELPEAGKVSVGVMADDAEMFVTGLAKTKLKVLDLADDMSKRTGKQIQDETNRRNMLIEQLDDYARDPNLSPELRGVFAGVAGGIKTDAMTLNGFAWARPQIPLEGVQNNNTLGYILGQIHKTKNQEALTMVLDDILKIWKVDAISNVRSIIGSTGGVVVLNGSKVGASYAQIGNALAEIAEPTNLGPNVAKLLQSLGDTDKQIAKTSERIKKLEEERKLLDRQMKDIDLFREYANSDPEMLAKLAGEDTNWQGIANIVKLKPSIDQKDALAEAVRDAVGIVDFPGGGIADIPRFRDTLKYMLGRQFQEVAEVVAKETSPSRIRRLFGNKLDAEMVVALSKAENSDDVLRIFLQQMGSVETDPQIFKSLALRGEAARLSSNPLARIVQPVNLLPLRSLENLDRVYSRFFVRSTALNLNDLTGLTNGVEDWISSAQFKTMLGKEGQERLIDDVVEKLLLSNNEQERAAIIANALGQAMEDIAKRFRIDENEAKKLAEKAKISGKITPAETAYSVGRVVDGADPEIVFAGDEVISLGGGISYFQLIKGTIYLPDSRELLKAFNRYSMNGVRYGAKSGRVLAEEVGDIWRTAQLAFRISYVLRNIGEMQMRQLLSGHTNIISNPLQFISMVMANSGKNNAFTKIARRNAKYQYDLAGNRFANELADGEYLEGVRGYQANAFRKESASDYRGNRSSEIFKFYRVLEANPQMSKETQKQFYKSLAYTINRFASDPINSKVARLVALGDETAKRDFVKSIIDDFDNPNSLIQKYISGVFKENDGIRRIFFKDVSLPDEKLLTKENLSAEKIFIFLFDETQEHTIAGQIRNIAGQGPQSRRILDILADEDAIKAPWNANVKTTREFDALEGKFASQLEKTFTLDDIKGSRVLSERERAGGAVGAKEINRLVDIFFTMATKLESKFNFGPEYQMAYWDFVGRYAGMLSTKELKSVYAKAQRSLAPIRVGGKVTKDAVTGEEIVVGGRVIGRKHPTLKVIEKQLKDRERGKSIPPAGGGAEWTTIHQMAANQASGYVKNLFYDASRQKQWAQAVRLIAPFAQAHTNTLSKWGELSVRNPLPIYRFSKAFDALTKEGSNVIYDATGMTYDDSQGFLYTQEGRDGKQFKMPLVGNFLGSLVGKNLQMNNALQVTAPVESLNLAFGQVNPLVPGFGPAVQFAFTASGASDKFGSGYQVMRDIITPFGQAESVSDLIFPSWLRKSVLFALGNDAQVQRNAKDWAAYLASTGEYGDNPLANDAARTRLFEDAQKLSKSLGFWMSIFQSISPATPSSEVLAKIKNPDNKMKFMTMSILYEHWDRISRANPGNYNAAVKQFADTYGKNNLLVILGTSTNAVRGTDDAWTFLNNNPDAAAKFARNPGDVVPFFFPGGEYSVKYYNWQKGTGARRTLSTQEIANEAEGMVYAMLKGQLVEEQIANGYPQFWLVQQIEKLDKQFGARPPDMIIAGTAQERIARVGLALQEPAMQDSPIYNETLEFYTKYSEFQKMLNDLKVANYAEIKSKGGYATLMRNDLVATAERLMTQNPSFSRMYYGVFYGQLEG
jgi:hypothetical protein